MFDRVLNTPQYNTRILCPLFEMNKFSLKSAAIVTECISDYNNTNECNNCLNLIYALNVYSNDEYYRYTNAYLKISLYARLHIRTINNTLKICILKPNNS